MFKPPSLPPNPLNPQTLNKYHGFLKGFSRSWSQLSTDHRGTPQAPGVVVNLVDDSSPELAGWEAWWSGDETKSKSKSKRKCDGDGCFGCVYVIPANISKGLIADLDFREKGGYVRVAGVVTVLDFGGEDGIETTKEVEVVLYRGVIPPPLHTQTHIIVQNLLSHLLSSSTRKPSPPKQ